MKLKNIRSIVLLTILFFSYYCATAQISLRGDVLTFDDDVNQGAVVWIRKADLSDEYGDMCRITIRSKREIERATNYGWDLTDLQIPEGDYIIQYMFRGQIKKELKYNNEKD